MSAITERVELSFFEINSKISDIEKGFYLLPSDEGYQECLRKELDIYIKRLEQLKINIAYYNK